MSLLLQGSTMKPYRKVILINPIPRSNNILSTQNNNHHHYGLSGSRRRYINLLSRNNKDNKPKGFFTGIKETIVSRFMAGNKEEEEEVNKRNEVVVKEEVDGRKVMKNRDVVGLKEDDDGYSDLVGLMNSSPVGLKKEGTNKLGTETLFEKGIAGVESQEQGLMKEGKHIHSGGSEDFSFEELLGLPCDNKYEEERAMNQAKCLLDEIHLTTTKEKNKHDRFEFVVTSRDGRDLMGRLIQLSKMTGDRGVTVQAFRHLMHLYALKGDYRSVQKLFDTMLERGMEPEPRSYHTLMNSYANAGLLKKTLEVFELTKLNTPCLDPHPYAILIKAYTKHNQLKEAFDVIDLMRQKTTPEASVYNSLIKACIDVRDVDKAWATLDLMRKDNCQPSLVTYILLFPIAQKKYLDRGAILLEEMLSAGIPTDRKAINSILTALTSKPEHYSTSLKFLESVIQNGFIPDAVTFSVLLHGAQLSKNIDDARSFFLKMISQNPPLENIQVAFSTMFSVYAQAFKRDYTKHVIQSEVAPPENLDFLLSPSPTSFDEAVKEAIKVHAYFEQHYLHQMTPYQLEWIRESYLTIFAHYNYFTEAQKYFQQHFSEGNTYPIVYTSMLGMCRRTLDRGLHRKLLDQVNLILAPITPSSLINLNERMKYKHEMRLVAGPLFTLYQEIIQGLIRFGELDLALNYFENQCRDPDIKRAHTNNYYGIFLTAIQRSSNPQHQARLDRIIQTYQPQFLGQV